MKGPVPITDRLLKQYNTDIIAFLEDQFILEDGHRMVLEGWQKELIMEPLFYDLTPEGLRRYSLALLGMPKKNGKSTIAAAIGLWFMFADEQFGEIIIAANNLDQASLVIFNKIKGAFRRNPQLKSAAKLYKNAIEMKKTGTVCRPIAHKYETAAGVNPTLVLFDELWGFPSREFYDELTTSPARKNPLALIVTYAGYDKQSLLYDIYDRGKKKADPEMFFLWLHENMASWVSDKYLATQKRRMPPNVYARFHENKWSSAADTFITDDDIAKLHGTPWMPQYGPSVDRRFDYVVANDLGLSHDRAVRAVGHFDPRDSKVYVDSVRFWEGTKARHVPIMEVEQDLVDCMHNFKAVSLVIDIWQMEYVMQRLKRFMANVRAFNFHTDMTFMSQTLITLLRNAGLVCFHFPEFDEELKRLVSKQTARGWKIEHLRGQRNDIAVAVGMMAVEAVKAAYGSAPVPDSATEEEHRSDMPLAGVREKDF